MKDFAKAMDEGYVDATAGVRRKTLVWGEHQSLCEFRLEGGRQLPFHSHPHEQAGYLVSGHLTLTIESVSHDVRPGDAWCVPGNVVHGADALEDSVAIEVFSPVREDYLP